MTYRAIQAPSSSAPGHVCARIVVVDGRYDGVGGEEMTPYCWFSISFIASLGWVCALSAISLILVCCWLLFNVLSGSLAASGRLARGLEQLRRKPAAVMMTTPRSHCLAVHAAELYDLCPAALLAVGEDWVVG